MTITPHALTVTLKNAAVSASIHAYTTDPGRIYCDYPTGITGPAYVDVAGTRTWRNGLKHGQYLARANCLQARVNCAWFLEINTADLLHVSGGTNNDYTVIRAVHNFNVATVQRTNYNLYLHQAKTAATTQYFLFGFGASPTDALGEVNTAGLVRQLAAPQIERCIWTYDGTTLRQYTTSGVTASVSVARAISGTMGATEAMVISFPCKFAKMEGGLPSQAQRVAFITSGTLPAGLAASYQGGHEIVESAPRFYDTSGATPPLDLSDVDVQYWPKAAASGDYTDTGFTTPAFVVPITVAADAAPGDYVVHFRRNRVGVPTDRVPSLPNAELYDEADVTVTVAVDAETVTIGPDIDCKVDTYPATIDLLISSNYDGNATVVSDNAALVPASPVVISGGVGLCTCTVSSDVTGATVAATGPGDDTDTCSVTVAEAATPLTIGPDQTLDALVDEIYLHLTGDDGPVSISSVPAFGLSGLPVVASIVDGVASVTLRRMTAGTYTVTATQGTSSASCTITIPSVLVPSDDYDLRLDLADIIEAIQVPANRSAYHYDETMKSDGEALDAEDGAFALHVIQTVDGPIIGGSTAVVLVQVAIESEPDHADMERFRAAIHDARMPSYVSSIYCESGDVTPMRGAYLVQYMMQVQLA